MSNIIPPMVSSTPPPMDDDNLDEDDDHFGDFSTADLSYELSEPSKLTFNTPWEENAKDFSDSPECDRFSDVSQHNGTHLILEFQDRSLGNTVPCFDTSDGPCIAASSQLQGTDSGVCSVSPNSVATSPVHYTDRVSPSVSPNSVATLPMPLADQTSPCARPNSVVTSPVHNTERISPSVSPNSVVTSPIHNAESVSPCVSPNSVATSPVIIADRTSPLPDDSSCSGEPIIKSSQEGDMERTVQTSISANCSLKQQQVIAQVVVDAVLLQAETVFNDITKPQHPDEVGNSSASLASDIRPSVAAGNRSELTDEESNPHSNIQNDMFESPVANPLSLDAQPHSDGLDVTSEVHEINSRLQNSEIFQDDEEFEDFATFDSAIVAVDKLGFPIETQQKLFEHENENIFLGKLDGPIEDDDDFCEFASIAVHVPAETGRPTGTPTSVEATIVKSSTFAATIEDDSDDDFGSFDTARISSAVENSQVSEAHMTAMFPLHSTSPCGSEITPTGSSSLVEGSSVWSQLRDVDTSNALTYQWINSVTNKMLLTALGIDARNILFGPKWNASVPRFAANLSVSPLLPIQAVPLVPTVEPVTPLPSTEVTEVPAAQFDWTSSGLVNPLDCLAQTSQRTAPPENTTQHGGPWSANQQRMSAEAARIIGQIPDISFMRSRVLLFPDHRPTQSLMQP